MEHSQRRTASYPKEDWQRIRAADADIGQRMVAAMQANPRFTVTYEGPGLAQWVHDPVMANADRQE